MNQNYAAEIIGNKWTPLIIGALYGNVGRFNDIQELLGINPRTLTMRLVYLEKEGIIEKTFPPSVLDPKEKGHPEYHLTKKGRDLYDVLKAMKKWNKSHRP